MNISSLLFVLVMVVFVSSLLRETRPTYATSVNLGIGNTGPTPTITVTVTPTPTPTPDIISPTIAITNPVDRSTVKHNSSITISANASDNVGVTNVTFSINGTLLCTDTVAPYTCFWSVGAKPHISYIIQAIAYDAAGNSSIATSTVSSR